jgi:predicted lipid carrier protein YhbT
VVIDVTGDVVRHVVCTVTGGRAAVVSDEPASPLAHITMDVETFVMLATGRATASALESRVAYAGDAEHGRKVTGALNMMI